jgi:Protein of unknown function (DUF3955)
MTGDGPQPARTRCQSWLKAVSSFALIGCIGCWAACRVIGSEIDDDGILREPFALIPLGWLLFAVGVAAGALYLIRDLRFRSRLASTGTKDQSSP